MGQAVERLVEALSY